MNPTKSVEDKIDEVLEHSGIGYCGNPFCDRPTMSHAEAKAELLRIIREDVIGEDEKPVKADEYSFRSLERFRNQLRAEQRSTLSTKTDNG